MPSSLSMPSSTCPSRTVLLAGTGLTALAVLAGVTVAGGAAGAATATRHVAFGGSAYGSTASVGTLVHSGATAYVPMCTTVAGASSKNKTAATALPGLGSIGATTTKVASTRSGSTLASTSSAHTATTSLLAGVIKASALQADAKVSLTGSTYRPSGSTTLVGLTIAGKHMPAHPRVNQTISLPGLGSVVLNAQSHSNSGGLHAESVYALKLTISVGNISALPAGTVRIGRAYATLHSPSYHRAYGSAYGTSVQVGGVVSSGGTAALNLPCGGTSSQTRTSSVAGVSVPAVVTTGAVTSRGRTTDSSGATTATTTSHVASVSLLGGKIAVHAVTTQANARRVGAKVTRSSTGTTVGALTVNGASRTVPALGKSLSIPGIGTLYVGRTITSSTGIRVYGIQLVLSATQGRLKKGTTLTVGAARAGVLS